MVKDLCREQCCPELRQFFVFGQFSTSHDASLPCLISGTNLTPSLRLFLTKWKFRSSSSPLPVLNIAFPKPDPPRSNSGPIRCRPRIPPPWQRPLLCYLGAAHMKIPHRRRLHPHPPRLPITATMPSYVARMATQMALDSRVRAWCLPCWKVEYLQVLSGS
jgi:hypothetical protein